MENKSAVNNHQIHLIFNIPRRKQILIFVGISVFLLLAPLGSALAFSTKLKGEGDTEYAKQNYAEALLKYKAARNWWLPERIGPKLRDRDLEIKTIKAEVMVKSAENYAKGIDAFDNKQYTEAKGLLSSLVLKDPHYQDAQNTLKRVDEVEKESSKPKIAPTATPKPKPVIIPPAQSINTPQLTQTNDNNTIQTPSPTPTPTPQTPATLMPDKPIIESFCDSKGNCVHSQFADQNSKSFLSSQPTVRVGETLSFTITVSGQETEGVLAFIITQGYDWLTEGARKPWTTNLTYTKTFSDKDVTTSPYLVYAYIKSQNDNHHRRPVCNWIDYPCDDSAQLQYTVLP